MDERSRKQKYRERRNHERLRDKSPCPVCGECRLAALESHHMAGRKYGDETKNICKNDHAVLTEMQEDHPQQIFDPPDRLERMAHANLGLADLFEVMITKLRDDATWLLNEARKSVPANPDPESDPK